MRPTVLANANASASAGVGGGGGNNGGNTNGITIPIHHEYGSPNTGAYGSPRQQQQQQHQQQQGAPQGAGQPHFQQGFGFEPDMDMDMDMDMFPRSRLGRMHDPFGSFNDPHFGFPQFNSLGRRRAADHMGRDDDFFNRLPSEFRQYIPEGFGHRRGGGGAAGESATLPRQHGSPHTQQQQSQQVPVQAGGGYYPAYADGMPQSPSKKLCDAAIQTEDPTVRAGGDQVDSAGPTQQQQQQQQYGGDNLKQHGLRNTVDLGIKSAVESEPGTRAQSAPPQEQQPINGKRQTPPPQPGQTQFGGTQTSPQTQFHKAYYPPHQQPHPQQRQQQNTPPPQPQTPGGTYIRTIPIFVEGRSEPIINSHKEIPNQNSAPQASASCSAKVYVPSAQAKPQQYQSQTQQQQHRPTPINTQQEQQQGAGPQGGAGIPPQTPHTLDSISKIQDIQRDVLDLMGHVEKFTGTRQDKEYAYLDEMLTRNLLKLDTIDTNGKDSIRLARKEAIKCIQASINVLEAKANENTKTAQQQQQGAADGAAVNTAAEQQESSASAENAQAEKSGAARKSASKEKVEGANNNVGSEAAETAQSEPEPVDAKLIQEPIPLPPPEGMQMESESTALASAESNVSESNNANADKDAENEAAAPASIGAKKSATAKKKIGAKSGK